jgi:acyl dehydratase
MIASYPKALLKLVPVVGGGGGALPDDVVTRAGARIERERLTAYQRVCGFRVGDGVPATYPHVLAFPLALDLMTRRSFPFAVLGLVHVANEIALRRPLAAGERLDLEVRAQDLRAHERGRAFDVVARAWADGEEVWTGRSTYLRRERGGAPPAERRAAAAPEATAHWRVGGDAGRRYAAVSGDVNPIHLHPLTARLFGFPRPIAHGMWVKARCLAALEGLVPPASVTAVRFKAPMPIPARAAFATWPEGAGRGFAVHDARSGRPHLTGTVAPL